MYSFEDYCKDTRVDNSTGKLYLYRGQNNTEWKLISSYSRFCYNNNCVFDLSVFNRMLDSFMHESSYYLGKEMNKLGYFQKIAFAQHYGLPTPFLDWTESPYIAAFFALCTRTLNDKGAFRIWRMEVDNTADYYMNQKEAQNLSEEFYIIKTRVVDTKRIWKQNGYFSYLNSNESLDDYLKTKNSDVKIRHYDIYENEWVYVMKDLKFMGITHGNIFDSLDGVARDIALDFLTL